METRIANHFGKGARYRDGLPIPTHLVNRLRSWPSIVELNRPDLLTLIRDAQRKSDRATDLQNLETLVTRNYGLALFRAIEEAKIALSTDDLSEVRLERDRLRVVQEITRAEFEAAISVQLRDARSCTLAALEEAGCDPEQIGLVITTGGSSLIPAFRSMLQAALPRAQLAATGTFTSVAAGLAIAGAQWS
jgi:hypothetical chaperone protein